MFVKIPATKRSISSRKKVHIFGINDADYLVQPRINGIKYMCPYYDVWQGMLRRCYSQESLRKRPTYFGCTVCKDWHLFSNFRAWMKTQDWKDKSLDKDIITPNNKVYSPDNCVFVTKDINSLLNKNEVIRGRYPLGVSAKGSGFRAKISAYGKSVWIGTYKTIEEAESAYKQYKYRLLLDIAKSHDDERVRNGLILHANLLYESSPNQSG